MNQPRNIASKYDKESDDLQLVSHITVIDKALHGNHVPLLSDPTWAKQNEINKLMLAKVNQIDETQSESFLAQNSFRNAVTTDFLKLRDAVLENSVSGDTTLEHLKKDQKLISSEVVTRTKVLASELATTSTVLESNVLAVDALQEAHQIVLSELSDVTKKKKSLEKRLESTEALLRDVTERLNVMFLKMEGMAEEIEALREEPEKESN